MHSNLIYGSLDPQVCPKTASRSVHPFCRDHGCGFCDKCRKRAYGTHHVTLITTYHIYHQCPVLHTHTHTHTQPFNGPFSATTRERQYQKGKTNLDFTQARDSEWQWHQLGHMQVCTLLQTDKHASTQLLSFLQAGCPSCRPTNSVKAMKDMPTAPNHVHTHRGAEAVTFTCSRQ